MSSKAPILVTGAAGNIGSVGRSVVKLLRKRNLPVRALVHRLDERSQALRDMGAELVVADLTNGADVVRALRGCKRMYFGMSVSPPYLQATAIVTAAARAVSDLSLTLAIFGHHLNNTLSTT
jgi:NAD(P)H dehydrogenase (quinone)